MTFLYSCRHDGDQYRISKFTENLDLESSYLCTFDECQCPAAERGKRCRHMDMLPKFVQRGAIDTGWMLDYDRGGWVDMRTQEEIDQPRPLAEEPEESYHEGTEPSIAPQPALIPVQSPSWRRF